MATFSTNLSLGDKAFGVAGSLDPYIVPLTIGMVRVERTLPRARAGEENPCYVEEYMCMETGVGSGTIWTYGKNIFATKEQAQAGVIRHQQAAYKRRAERDAREAKRAEQQRQEEILTLERLKAKYEE